MILSDKQIDIEAGKLIAEWEAELGVKLRPVEEGACTPLAKAFRFLEEMEAGEITEEVQERTNLLLGETEDVRAEIRGGLKRKEGEFKDWLTPRMEALERRRY